MFLQKPMLGTQLDWSNPLNDGVVLDLLMNEGHGDIVHDLSGYGNHGTLHGFDFPPTRASGWNPGMDGFCLTFDAANDVINCGNNPSLSPSDAMTLDVLAKPSGTQDVWAGMIGQGDESAVLMLQGSGSAWTMKFVVDTGIVFLHDNVPYTNYDGNTWVRFTATYGNNAGYLYKNGVRIAIDKSKSGAIHNPSTDFLIGNINTGHFYRGAIARASILPRTMSAFEVMQTQIDPYGVYQQ